MAWTDTNITTSDIVIMFIIRTQIKIQLIKLKIQLDVMSKIILAMNFKNLP